MTPITTNNRNILAVEVPVEATPELRGRCDACTRVNTWHCAHADTCGSAYDVLTFADTEIKLPSGNHRIIGTLTPVGGVWEFDFDAAEYVEVMMGLDGRYKDYTKRSYSRLNPQGGMILVMPSCESKYDSFVSLLQANGMKVMNPIGAKPKTGHNGRHSDWQAAQDELIKNKIVIIEIK